VTYTSERERRSAREQERVSFVEPSRRFACENNPAAAAFDDVELDLRLRGEV